MSWRRIIVAAVLAGLTPFLVGFLFGFLGGAADAGWLLHARVWSIRVLQLIVFVWLGWAQRRDVATHAAVATGLAWVVGETAGFFVWLFIRWVETKADLPPVPSWSPQFSFLLDLAAIGALGTAAGFFLRRGAAGRHPAA